jgi:hypothetical protein
VYAEAFVVDPCFRECCKYTVPPGRTSLTLSQGQGHVIQSIKVVLPDRLMLCGMSELSQLRSPCLHCIATLANQSLAAFRKCCALIILLSRLPRQRGKRHARRRGVDKLSVDCSARVKSGTHNNMLPDQWVQRRRVHGLITKVKGNERLSGSPSLRKTAEQFCDPNSPNE